MHGAYKQPGGKLVQVELDVADGMLTDVVVSGDFFIYPDEAFVDLARSVTGLPADLPEADLTERIQAGLRSDMELLGTSPAAIAIAVRRALEGGPDS